MFMRSGPIQQAWWSDQKLTVHSPCPPSLAGGSIRRHSNTVIKPLWMDIHSFNNSSTITRQIWEEGLRRNCTRWTMNVGPGWEDRIERDGSRDGRAGSLSTGHVPGFQPPFVQFLNIAFPLSLLWFEMLLFTINILVLWLLLGAEGRPNIFLSNLRKTFLVKVSGKFPKKGTKCKIIRWVKW